MPKVNTAAPFADTRELAELCTHLQEHAETQRHELARRLHDELGGLLTAAKMDLSWIQSHMDAGPLRERLIRLGDVLDHAMDLKRQVVEELRPSLLDHFGLPTALRAHVESVCARAGLACKLTLDEGLSSLPRQTAIALFRVVEEGLDNIVRHAHAQQVRIELVAEGAHHVIRLSDDGAGIDWSDKTRQHHGLNGMRHRIEGIGGRFHIESEPGKGAVIEVAVPRP